MSDEPTESARHEHAAAIPQLGRVRFGRLHCGDRLCAEATGLFVALRPGQP